MPKPSTRDHEAARAVVAHILQRGPVGRALRQRLLQAFIEEGAPLSKSALFDWRKLKCGVPPRRVKVISRVLGLSPAEIRPDLFARRHVARDNRVAAAAIGTEVRDDEHRF